MKDVIVMSKTMKESCQVCRSFVSKYHPIIRNKKHSPFEVTLLDGTKILFRADTLGQRAIRGYRAEIIRDDEFLDWFFENKMNNLESAT